MNKTEKVRRLITIDGFYYLSLDLKVVRVGLSTTCNGKLFHSEIVLGKKEFLKESVLDLIVLNLNRCCDLVLPSAGCRV